MKLFFSILLIAIALAGCTSGKGDTPLADPTEGLDEPCTQPTSSMVGIVNGREVSPQDADSKMAVLIYIQKVRAHTICTGALIGQNLVLTAAHCLKGIKAEAVTVRFMKDSSCNSKRPLFTKIASEKILIHDRYNQNKNYNNDLALIKLAQSAPSDFPIASLYDGASPLSSDELLMLGYGDSAETSQEETQLRKTYKSYTRDVTSLGQEIAFDQSQGGGACHGDSGGPIFGNVQGQYKIIGVVSRARGQRETACHQESLANFVPFYRDWIEKNSQFD
jgi:secreted trypsin-like serine protease